MLAPRMKTVSIPSFAGHGLRPRVRIRWVHVAQREFQSPPSRGMGCDSADDVTIREAGGVSIPSFAGHGLRRAAFVASSWLNAMFQSPPSRGMGCDPGGPQRMKGENHARFNPLLRGAWAATIAVAGWVLPPEDASFQSPPSRGMGCDSGPWFVRWKLENRGQKRRPLPKCLDMSNRRKPDGRKSLKFHDFHLRRPHGRNWVFEEGQRLAQDGQYLAALTASRTKMAQCFQAASNAKQHTPQGSQRLPGEHGWEGMALLASDWAWLYWNMSYGEFQRTWPPRKARLTLYHIERLGKEKIIYGDPCWKWNRFQ